MSILFSDNFNRAGSADLGANWSEIGNTFWYISDSNQLQAPGEGAPLTIRTTTNAHAAVANVKVTIKRITGSGFGGGVIARASGSSGSESFYGVFVYGTNNIDIVRVNAGVGVSLVEMTQSHAANDTYALGVYGTGSDVTLRAFRNGVQVGSDVVDSSGSRITAAGQTGIFSYTELSPIFFDDFVVEDFDLSGGGGSLINRPRNMTGGMRDMTGGMSG